MSDPGSTSSASSNYPQHQPLSQTPTAPPTDKSVAAALVLTFFFGPFGLFYVTVVGAIVMVIVAIIVGILTLGFGLFIIWPITMLWAALTASKMHQSFETWKIERLAPPSR